MRCRDLLEVARPSRDPGAQHARQPRRAAAAPVAASGLPDDACRPGDRHRDRRRGLGPRREVGADVARPQPPQCSLRQAQHQVKRVDRLLGNAHLVQERALLYRAIAHALLATTPRPILLIDWADCGSGGAGPRWLLLRAAVPLGGRALPIYEEVHPLWRYNSPRTHRRFLAHLHAVLPATCRPILITDAGFRGPWFRAVERYGWDWIGRVRNSVKYRVVRNADDAGDDHGPWAYTTALYAAATPRPRHLGRVWLGRRQAYACELYLVRQYRRGPGRPRKAHGQRSAAHRCRRLHKDPWLLDTSLPHHAGPPRQTVKPYGLRMKIEEGSPDTKKTRWGFALRDARCHRAERM